MHETKAAIAGTPAVMPRKKTHKSDFLLVRTGFALNFRLMWKMTYLRRFYRSNTFRSQTLFTRLFRALTSVITER